MSQPFPFPPLQAFERLQITDGLLMTADLWQRAHGYHRQRQNFVYQALHHAAVVYGLGVVAIEPPEQVQSAYRDGRWVEIQPGVAIDGEGNPIVVAQAETFRLESEPSPGEQLRVYLTVSYVDPDELTPGLGDRVSIKERFRIVEKMTLEPRDVELCRICLEGQDIILRPAANVFEPGINEIDLLHRPMTQLRPEGMVRLVQLTDQSEADSAITRQLRYLIKAMHGLYPSLGGQEETGAIAPEETRPEDLADDEAAKSSTAPTLPLSGYDVIYAPWNSLQRCNLTTYEQLAEALHNGSLLLVSASPDEVGIAELYHLQAELQLALDNTGANDDLTSLRSSIEAELNAFNHDIDSRIQELIQSLQAIATMLHHPLQGDGTVNALHPLRLEPFLFSQLPTVEGCPLTMRLWGPILLVIGDLARQWGPDETLSHSRETIRSAQELGINLLHFAWRQRHLTQLQGNPFRPGLPPTPDSLRDRIPGTEA